MSAEYWKILSGAIWHENSFTFLFWVTINNYLTRLLFDQSFIWKILFGKGWVAVRGRRRRRKRRRLQKRTEKRGNSKRNITSKSCPPDRLLANSHPTCLEWNPPFIDLLFFINKIMQLYIWNPKVFKITVNIILIFNLTFEHALNTWTWSFLISLWNNYKGLFQLTTFIKFFHQITSELHNHLINIQTFKQLYSETYHLNMQATIHTNTVHFICSC